MIIPEIYTHSSPCPYSIDGGPEDRRCTCGLDDLMEELGNYEVPWKDKELRVYRAAPELRVALNEMIRAVEGIPKETEMRVDGIFGLMDAIKQSRTAIAKT